MNDKDVTQSSGLDQTQYLHEVTKSSPPLTHTDQTVSEIGPSSLKGSEFTNALDPQHSNISAPISIVKAVKVSNIDLEEFAKNVNVKDFLLLAMKEGLLDQIFDHKNFHLLQGQSVTYVIYNKKSNTLIQNANQPVNFSNIQNIQHLNLPPQIKANFINNQVNVINVSNQQWGQLTTIVHTAFTQFIAQLGKTGEKIEEKEDEKSTSSPSKLNNHRYKYQPVISPQGKIVQNSVKVPFGVLLKIFEFIETSKTQFIDALREEREQNAKDLKKYRAEDDFKYDINKEGLEKDTVKTTLHKHYEQVVEAMKKAA